MVKKKGASKKSVKKSSKKNNNSSDMDPKVKAFITTFFSIIGFIIALVSWRDDKYVMYYAKQSLVLFVIWIIVAIIGSLFIIIPFIGWFIVWGLNILVLVLWIFTWINALSGKKKEVPLVSNFTSKFEL